jgi:hypothetical protein
MAPYPAMHAPAENLHRRGFQSDVPSIAIAVVLAFFFGYSLTLLGLLSGRTLDFRAALGVALAADTVSIAVMELVDNAVVVP